MRKLNFGKNILLIMFVALLSGIIPSLSVQPLYAQTSSISLDHSFIAPIYHYHMYGNSTLTVTGPGAFTETFYMYGEQTFTERVYYLQQGSTYIDSGTWPSDVIYPTFAGRFEVTRSYTGKAAATYTVTIGAQQRDAAVTYDHPTFTHSITLYGYPVTGTPTITARTTTSLTMSASVTNPGHGVTSGRFYIGGTWYAATVNGSTISYTKTGLTPGTSYGVYAEATTIEGADQSGAASLTTLNTPTVTTQAVTAITASTATGNGNITNLGVPNPTAYGHCWATTSNPTLANSSNNLYDASTTGAYTSSLTGLAGLTLYYVRAYATNDAGTVYGAQVSFTTLLGAPGASAATYVGTTGCRANWTAVTGATGYYLDVCTSWYYDTYLTGYQSRDVGNVTNFWISGLVASTDYYYRLRAYNSTQTSDYGGGAGVTTGPPAPVPNGISSLGTSYIGVRWLASTGATGYRVDLSTSISFSTFVSTYNNYNVGNVLTTNFTGLNSGTQYYWRVRAYNANASSDNINPQSQFTMCAAPVATAASSITQTGLSANWNASTGATSYRLDVSTVNNFASYVTGYSNLNVGLVTTYPVTGLTANTTYYYRVKAVNSVGTTSSSNIITTATYLLPTVTTQAVTAITTTTATGNGNVTVLGIPSPTAYGHCYGTTTGPTITGYHTDLGAASATGAYSSSLTSLYTGTTYYVKAYATNAAGTVYGSEVSFTTVPAAPTISAATAVIATGFSANWSAATGAASYRLDVSTVNTFASFVTGYNNLTLGNVTTYAVTGLSSGTTYYCRVRAVNTSGTSINSDNAIVLTISAAPVATAATSLTDAGFTANWSAATGAASYRLDVSTVNTFASFVTGYNNLTLGNVTTSAVTGLSAGTTYYYRVRAVNTGGTSSSSNTITALTLPGTATYTSPTNSATGVSRTPTLAWTAPSGTVSGYKVYLGTNTPPTNLYNGSTTATLSFSPSTLLYNTIYYWKIVPYNVTGDATGASIYSFTTLTLAPTVTTQAVTAITTTTATGNGNITVLGVPNPTQHGHCWATTSNPTTDNSKTTLGTKSATGAFTSSLTGLSAGTLYYVNAYATNSAGTVYGGQVSFTTISAAPVATAASSITSSGFTANWNAATGAASYRLDVSTVNNFASFVAGYNDLVLTNVLTYVVTGLSAGTTYYFRVRAVNSGGTSVSSNTISTSSYQTPTVTTQAVTAIATTTATGNGNVTALGVPNPTQYGHCWATTSNPTTASSITALGAKSATGAYSSSLTSLSTGTTYYVKAYATNAAGTAYGTEVSFLTIPAAPVASAATSITAAGFTANWSAATGATTYFFDVSTSSSFTTNLTGYDNLTVGNVLLKAVTGLSAGTTYYYRVRAYNASGTSANSSQITVLTIPAAPTATDATSLSTTGFTANWGSVTSATTYYFDVSTSSGFTTNLPSYNNLNVGNVTSKAVTGLSVGSTYYYRVRAYNASGTGASSNSITVVTYQTPTVTTQATTSIGTATATGNGNVTALGVPNPTQHGHCWALTSNPTTANSKTTLGTKSATGAFTSSLTGLSAGTLYYVKSYATNAAGTVYGTAVSFTTISAAPVATAASSITSSGFTANWNAVTGATSYRLDVSTVSNFASFVTGYNDLVLTNVLTYAVTGLSSGTTYYYRVRAVNSGGTSVSSNTISTSSYQTPTVTTQDVSAITISTATGNGTVTNLGNPNPTQHGHCWSLVENPTTDDSKTQLGGKSTTGAFTSSLTGLSAGTEYFVRAYATNTQGTSYGNEVSFFTIPLAPTVTAAGSVSSSGFMANWSAATGADSYELDVSTVSNFAGFVTGYADLNVSNVTTYAVSGLSAGTTYYYRVRAVNTGGTSANSSYQTVLTLPGTATYSSPANNATGVSRTPSLSWTAPAGTVTGYKVYFGTDTPPTNIVNGTTQTANTYAPAALYYNTTYYWKVVPYNATGDASGASIYSFITLTLAPTVTIDYSSDITPTTATGNGTITVLGNPNPTQYGHVWNTTGSPNISTSDSKTELGAASATGAYTSSLTGLTAGTLYYIRAYATNAAGTAYSAAVTFTTTPVAPVADAASAISTTGFTANWSAANGATGYRLDVSAAIGFGSCLTGYDNLDVSNVLSYAVSGLSAGTTYYYRVRAYNSGGTGANSDVISTSSTATYNVTIDRGNITGVHVYTDDHDYGTDPANPLVFEAGFSGTFHVEKTDYVWELATGSDSNIIANLSGDKQINFVGTYTHVDTVNPGFVYTGEPDIPITATAGSIETLVVPLPALTPVGAVVIVFTGLTVSDVTISVPLGTWYVIAYYDDPADGGLAWHHATPYPAVGASDVVFYNVPFGAKSDIPVIVTGADATLPVELSSFTALPTAEYFVTLQWTTQSETNLNGYYIYRNTEAELNSALRINTLLPAVNSSSATDYNYTDSEVETGNTYYYWLQAVDLDGSLSYYGPISVTLTDPGEGNDVPIIPVVTALLPAYPNPFNPTTTIAYKLKQAEQVSITICNVKGQTVKHYTRSHATGGDYRIVWDGKSDNGRALASGIYYIIMQAGKDTYQTKAVLLK